MSIVQHPPDVEPLEPSLKEDTPDPCSPHPSLSPVGRGRALLRPLSQRRSVRLSPAKDWAAGLIPLCEPTSPALWPAWGEGGAQLAWRMGGPPVGGGDSGKEATAWGPAAWGSPGPI